MKDRDLDIVFDKLKGEIPVNQALKHKLRKSFMLSKKRGLMKKIIASAIAAAVICAVLILPKGNNIQKVSAVSLRVSNHISFLNIGGGGGNMGVSEYKGTIYIPVAGKGLFAYDKSGFHRIYDKEVNFTRVSPDGKKLVFSAGGTLEVLDVESGGIREILKDDDSIGVYYEEPSWSPDGKKIIYVKRVIESDKTHGLMVKEPGIYEINLDTLKTYKLGDGSYPSYIKDSDSIVYEKQGNVVIKNLKDNSEKTVDSGRFPSVAPDGSLIAYVKEQLTNKKQGPLNAEVEEYVADIWIADILDTNIKKKVTSNYPYRFISEEEWLKSLQPSEVPQVLSYHGAYYYYNLVWSSDSKSLFALKNSTAAGETADNMRLIRIDLAQERLSSVDTVKKFIQALILRDEDYAKSLMKSPVESPLTISNPRQIGYNILSTGIEDGKDYVDAEVYWQYAANPYYEIAKSRYYLSPSDDGYLIDNIIEISNKEIYEREGAIYYIEDGNKAQLLKGSDIPGEYMPKNIPYRVSCLVYHEYSQTLIMSIQYMDENGESTSVKLLSYNVKDRRFGLIDEIKAEKGSLGVSGLSVDATGRYLEADLFFQDEKRIRNATYVYDLQSKSRYALGSLMQDTDIDSVKSSFWCEDGLIFDVTASGQTMCYLFRPDKTPQVQTVGNN